MRVFNLDVKVADQNEGRTLSRPCVYVALNQSTLLDSAVWLHAIPVPTWNVMNFEFALFPFFGWAVATTGSVVVVRQWHGQAMRAMQRARRLLAEGKSIGISIEGRRTGSGTLAPYKKGPVVLAIDAQVSLVPVVLHKPVAPGPSWRVCAGEAKFTLLEAIPTEGLTRDDRHRMVARLRAIAERELGR
jgi:1-acyl-sn-glycerol-3-phosphate acyltransferase